MQIVVPDKLFFATCHDRVRVVTARVVRVIRVVRGIRVVRVVHMGSVVQVVWVVQVVSMGDTLSENIWLIWSKLSRKVEMLHL